MLFLSGPRVAALVENDADRPGRREGDHDTANGHGGAVPAGITLKAMATENRGNDVSGNDLFLQAQRHRAIRWSL